MEEDIKALLEAWHLEGYVELFAKNKINIDCLHLLDVQMIKELFPVIGDRAIFTKNLENWVKLAQSQQTDKENLLLDLDTTREVNIDVLSDKHRDPFSSISNIEMFQLDNENKTCESIVLTSSPIASTSKDDSLWDLQNSCTIESTVNHRTEVFQSKKLLDILQSSVDGRLLLSLHQEDGLLNSSSRRKLCNIIIKYLLGDDPKMATIPSAILCDMAFQIKEIFKKENISTYFIPYINNKKLNIKRCAKGKLYDCLHNRKREYRLAQKKLSSSFTSTDAASNEGGKRVETLDVSDDVAWIKSSTEPWKILELKWKNTINFRQEEAKKLTISQYMALYPGLKKPTGYHLLCIDFDALYPDAKDNLYKYFVLSKKAIFELANKKYITNKGMQETIMSITNVLEEQNQEGSSEEVENISAFMLLPLLAGLPIQKKSKKNCWRPSRQECQDGFITHVSRQMDLQETIKKRNEKYFNYEKDRNTMMHNLSDNYVSLNSLNSLNTIQNASYHGLPTVIETSSAQSETDSTDSLVKFTAALYGNTLIPRNVVQFVISNVTNMVSNSVIKPLQEILSECQVQSQGQMSIEISERLRSHLNAFSNSMNDVRTEHTRFLLFKNLGTYIEPTEYIIGQRIEGSHANNNFRLNPIPATGQSISVRLVLKRFFELNNNMFKETIQCYNEYLASSNSDIIQNIVQGSVWQNKLNSFNGKIVLPLALYFDDYELDNPLGSHAGVHKLGAVYISVLCLPPKYLSKLRNIFLALLFHSSDRQKFGNRLTFAPVISELNFLSQHGIELNFPNELPLKVYFELAVILGDNLGIHSLIGFSESFSGNFPCRICKIHKKNLKYAHECDHELYRTMEQYLTDLDIRDVTTTGIKEECVWHDVDGFSVIDNVGVDIMHDLLEGVCKYDLSFLLHTYIFELKLFTIETLNNRLISFGYGPDRDNQPPCVLPDHIRKQAIKMSASEMLCFVRYFGLLLGDLIPSDDPLWELYLCLRKIFDIVTSTHLQRGMFDLLQCLVSEHHKLYIFLSKKSLTPKFHFLTHYQCMLKKFGPLVSIWSMRFEAKHRISKLSANVSSNRRNICKSLAIRHQLKLNDSFLNDNNVGKEYGHKKLVSHKVRQKIINCLNLNDVSIEDELRSVIG
ncbi:unnamed protein product, partial [Brenthis ino]